MKDAKTIILAVLMVIPFGLIAQDHPHSGMSHENHNMNHNNEEIMQHEVSNDFKKQLNALYQASLELNNSFVAGEAIDVQSKAVAMRSKMRNINMSLVKGDAHMEWMAYVKPINEGLKVISESSDIAEQRALYAGVSKGLYKSIKAFGIGETVYYQYCPMKKSSWLSNSEDIKNPYYGSMMLTCGSTIEVLN